ncbi:MAG: aminotransferase class V-fold PLP-dependent enzyme [Rhodobacteraceae bacterium]|nr:aminotransferase class V-fold PLP-dependent enzyme [Paracoccaceae bacterium]
MSLQNPVFIPGPTNMPDAIRKACDLPTIDHRSPAFARLFRPAVEGVRRVLRMAGGEVIVLPATGTGGWEAAVTNTLSPGDHVLAARYGMFSQRWIDLCRRHGLQVEVLETPWGQGAPADRIEAALRADTGGRIKAVLATHNETATGVRSDIAGIRGAMDRAGHGALLFVDGVSSIASMPFEMAEWGVDIAVAGSQKGFMLPAGLAILGVSDKALAAMETARLPRCYFDFRDMLKAYAAGGYPYTPAAGLIAGLARSVEMLEDEGLPAVYARHARLAEGVRRAVAGWGLRPCAATPDLCSDTVTAVVVPPGCNGTDLVALAARKYGVAFGVGLGEVAGKVFRIGHLGMLTEVLVLSGLATAEMCMADLGWPVQLGSGVAAAQEFYRGSVPGMALAAE